MTSSPLVIGRPPPATAGRHYSLAPLLITNGPPSGILLPGISRSCSCTCHWAVTFLFLPQDCCPRIARRRRPPPSIMPAPGAVRLPWPRRSTPHGSAGCQRTASSRPPPCRGVAFTPPSPTAKPGPGSPGLRHPVQGHTHSARTAATSRRALHRTATLKHAALPSRPSAFPPPPAKKLIGGALAAPASLPIGAALRPSQLDLPRTHCNCVDHFTTDPPPHRTSYVTAGH